MDNYAGIIAITTITLLFISAAELWVQKVLCHTAKQYVISLFVIIILNTTLTSLALMVTFSSDVGTTAMFYLFASMAFPLFWGLMRIVDIKEDDELKFDATGFLNRKKNNAR